MLLLWGSLAGLLFYLEVVYHISGFGFTPGNPLFVLLVVFSWASLETMVVGCLRGKAKKIVYLVFVWFSIVWTGAQIVYLHIFKQPLLWEAAIQGGQDAVTNYWREALTGILEVSPVLLLLLLPGVVLCILLYKKKWTLPQFGTLQVMRTAVAITASLAALVVDLEAGRLLKVNYYEDYTEFFDALTVAENLGVHACLQRDTALQMGELLADAGGWIKAAVGSGKGAMQAAGPAEPGGNLPESAGGTSGDGTAQGKAEGPGDGTAQGEAEGSKDGNGPEDIGGANGGNAGDDRGGEGSGSGNNAGLGKENGGTAGAGSDQQEPEIFVPVPHAFALDYESLEAAAENKKQQWLATYIRDQQPTMTNEYTGIFEGYNLIFLTAEGFSPYAVREDLTPTLYHLIHTGFVFDNYYVPLWQTSTSDGEYINCTGLIPDGQFSMKKSAENSMPYTLAGYFNREGLQSRAYHNNNLSYYSRHLTHPNLGYLFKACNLGGLPEAEYGQYVFQMEGADQWPASDYEMMVSTLPEYLQDERFHAYYMTVSGHMNYNFLGNSMARKNQDAVSGLEMSENAQAYIACNIELDKALEYLLEQLREAGKLENTVIALSADHYPYAMSEEQYEELAGRDLDYGKDLFRNNLILWNVAYEEEPVLVHKACGSMDLLPTLLNLFGFDYDSRMFAGRDIFSEEEGMVIFNDRSFVTDGLIYDRSKKETIWLTDPEGKELVPEEEREAYLEEKQQEVKDRYQFSAYVLQENYYQDIEDARIRD